MMNKQANNQMSEFTENEQKTLLILAWHELMNRKESTGLSEDGEELLAKLDKITDFQ